MSGYIDDSALMKLLDLQAQTLDLVSKVVDLARESHGVADVPGNGVSEVGDGPDPAGFRARLAESFRRSYEEVLEGRGEVGVGSGDGHGSSPGSSVVGASEGTGAAVSPEASAAPVSEEDAVDAAVARAWLPDAGGPA